MRIRNGTQLLIVDDNLGDIHLIEMAIEANGMDISVSSAPDGVVAQEELTRRAAAGDFPDLVLLDLNMPRIGGLQVLKFMADRGILGRSAVVVLTTSVHPTDREKSLALGAREVLTKPQDFEDLVTMVKGLSKYFPLPVSEDPQDASPSVENS
jgi:CheY-like chemotaxis protein